MLRASVLLNGVLLLLLVGLGVWRLTRTQVPVDYWQRQHHEARTDLFGRLDPPSGHVIMAGDSLTERGEWGELLGRPDVLNRGIAGDTTEGLLKRSGLMHRARPRLLVLMIGINDLEAGQTPPQIASRVETLLVQFRRESPKTKVLLQSILPMRDVGRGIGVAAADVEATNAGLKALCMAPSCEYVDLWPSLADQGALAPDVTGDGIHLNGTGYQRWAKALSPHLSEATTSGASTRE